ncbi:MAG: zinc ribbon domain-containing protein [Thermoanaerobaculia bacterium]
MPVFEFRCDSCEARSEELVLAGDAPGEILCPKCGSSAMSRLLSTFAAQSGSPAGRPASGFDPGTACGGGPCQTPQRCGGGDVN